MALGMYIAVAVGIIIAIIIVKLIRSTNKSSFFGGTDICNACDRKTSLSRCPFCHADSKSLR